MWKSTTLNKAMKKSSIVEQYKKIFLEIAEQFVKKYHSYDDWSISEWFVIGETLPMWWNIICVSDERYWWVDDMLTCIELDIPKAIVFEWYGSMDKEHRPVNLYHLWMKNKCNVV